MISADARERHGDLNADRLHDDFMVKPINLTELLKRISRQLDLQWTYDGDEPNQPAVPPSLPGKLKIPDLAEFERLRAFAEIGYLKGVQTLLDELRRDERIDPALLHYLDHLAREAQLEKIAQLFAETVR